MPEGEGAGSANAAGGGGEDLAQIKEQLANAEKAREDFKRDMLRYKDERGELQKQLSELQKQLSELEKRQITDEDQDILDAAKEARRASEEQDENAKLRRTKKGLEQENLNFKSENDKLKVQLEMASKQLKQYTVRNEVTRAALEANAIKPDQIVALLENQFGLDDNGVVIVPDQDGDPKRGENGLPLAVKDVVSNFLSENQHLVKPGEAKSGAGSSGATGKIETTATNKDALLQEVRAGKMSGVEAAHKLLSAKK